MLVTRVLTMEIKIRRHWILKYTFLFNNSFSNILYTNFKLIISIYEPKQELYDFNNIGAPRKLRSSRTRRAKKQVTATNSDNWSFKISGASKHLMVERNLGFHKRSKSSSFKWKPKKKKSSGRFVAFYDDYRGPARHPPRHN